MTTFDAHLTRRAALDLAERVLAGGDIDAAPGDACHLTLHALGVTRTDLVLHGDRAVGEMAATRLAASIERRLAGEPVARILGEWEFWGLPFALSPETLVPRPDTETLVETVLARWPDRARPLRLLDLGTGTGCILIALLTEYRHAFGVGIDLSHAALLTASANARVNGVADRSAFAAMSWCDALAGSFDVIVSNPPYIAGDVIAGLSTEVRCHDPRLALDGGDDGLEAYRSILEALARVGPGFLAPGGTLHLEIGFDQAAAVSDLARHAGFAEVVVARDLAGHDRTVSLGQFNVRPDRTGPLGGIGG
ncbi:peptide chain release factor N(5)-glutamine methyltransferase [uncultured Methylobacterium sp.]|uniref:peptide chain release factor N(5)-glutamine methyltransferase n=1 Tax=uncultured Methylobacterium sp. TaxID=157278 RepID=UPI0035C96B63